MKIFNTSTFVLEITDAARHAHDLVPLFVGISVRQHLCPSVYCPSAYSLYVPGAGRLSRLFAPPHPPPLVCCFGAFASLGQRFSLRALEKCFRWRRIGVVAGVIDRWESLFLYFFC